MSACRVRLTKPRISWLQFPRFFCPRIHSLIRSGIGVTAVFLFHVQLGSSCLLARTLTSVNAKPIVAIMTRHRKRRRHGLGVLSAAGVLTLIPGAVVILVRAQLHREGVCDGSGVGRGGAAVSWMVWTVRLRSSSYASACCWRRWRLWKIVDPNVPRKGWLPITTTAAIDCSWDSWWRHFSTSRGPASPISVSGGVPREVSWLCAP